MSGITVLANGSVIIQPPTATAAAAALAPGVAVIRAVKLPRRLTKADVAFMGFLGDLLWQMHQAGAEPVLAVLIVCGMWAAYVRAAD